MFTLWEIETKTNSTSFYITCADNSREYFDNISVYEESIFICGQPKQIKGYSLETFINYRIDKIING